MTWTTDPTIHPNPDDGSVGFPAATIFATLEIETGGSATIETLDIDGVTWVVRDTVTDLLSKPDVSGGPAIRISPVGGAEVNFTWRVAGSDRIFY